MATHQFLTSIFPNAEDEQLLASSRTELHFGNLQDHIKCMMSKSELNRKPVLEAEEKAKQDGRIGSETVLVDISSQCGTMNIGIERMELESQSNFSSIRANVCACKDKWMYEVLLGSKGIMQLGWATIRCRFTNEKVLGILQILMLMMVIEYVNGIWPLENMERNGWQVISLVV